MMQHRQTNVRRSYRSFWLVGLLAVCLVGLARAQTTGISRWAFTSGIRDREPVDRITTPPDHEMVVYFFTELSGMEGTAVQHVWLRDGVEVFRLAFDVRSSRWRVYSSKQVSPGAVWSVRVEDDRGNVLGTYELGKDTDGS
jgi:hypothetical protein